MCEILNISMSGYYAYEEHSIVDDIHSEIVEKTFNENYRHMELDVFKQSYVTRV